MMTALSSHVSTGGKGTARTVCGIPRNNKPLPLAYANKFDATCIECQEELELQSMLMSEHYSMWGYSV